MKLPNAENAVVDIAKLRDYCLSETHEVGSHKARVFRSVLGLTIENAEWLREQILIAAYNLDAEMTTSIAFGERYCLDFELTFEEKTAVIRTSWIVEYGTDFPRLTMCYVKGQ